MSWHDYSVSLIGSLPSSPPPSTLAYPSSPFEQDSYPLYHNSPDEASSPDWGRPVASHSSSCSSLTRSPSPVEHHIHEDSSSWESDLDYLVSSSEPLYEPVTSGDLDQYYRETISDFSREDTAVRTSLAVPQSLAHTSSAAATSNDGYTKAANLTIFQDSLRNANRLRRRRRGSGDNRKRCAVHQSSRSGISFASSRREQKLSTMETVLVAARHPAGPPLPARFTISDPSASLYVSPLPDIPLAWITATKGLPIHAASVEQHSLSDRIQGWRGRCLLCPRKPSFSRASDMTRHFKRHIKSDLTWPCPVCSRSSAKGSLSRKDALLRHCRDMHADYFKSRKARDIYAESTRVRSLHQSTKGRIL